MGQKPHSKERDEVMQRSHRAMVETVIYRLHKKPSGAIFPSQHVHGVNINDHFHSGLGEFAFRPGPKGFGQGM